MKNIVVKITATFLLIMYSVMLVPADVFAEKADLDKNFIYYSTSYLKQLVNEAIRAGNDSDGNPKFEAQGATATEKNRQEKMFEEIKKVIIDELCLHYRAVNKADGDLEKEIRDGWNGEEVWSLLTSNEPDAAGKFFAEGALFLQRIDTALERAVKKHTSSYEKQHKHLDDPTCHATIKYGVKGDGTAKTQTCKEFSQIHPHFVKQYEKFEENFEKYFKNIQITYIIKYYGPTKGVELGAEDGSEKGTGRWIVANAVGAANYAYMGLSDAAIDNGLKGSGKGGEDYRRIEMDVYDTALDALQDFVKNGQKVLFDEVVRWDGMLEGSVAMKKEKEDLWDKALKGVMTSLGRTIWDFNIAIFEWTLFRNSRIVLSEAQYPFVKDAYGEDNVYERLTDSEKSLIFIVQEWVGRVRGVAVVIIFLVLVRIGIKLMLSVFNPSFRGEAKEEFMNILKFAVICFTADVVFSCLIEINQAIVDTFGFYLAKDRYLYGSDGDLTRVLDGLGYAIGNATAAGAGVAAGAATTALAAGASVGAAVAAAPVGTAVLVGLGLADIACLIVSAVYALILWIKFSVRFAVLTFFYILSPIAGLLLFFKPTKGAFGNMFREALGQIFMPSLYVGLYTITFTVFMYAGWTVDGTRTGFNGSTTLGPLTKIIIFGIVFYLAKKLPQIIGLVSSGSIYDPEPDVWKAFDSLKDVKFSADKIPTEKSTQVIAEKGIGSADKLAKKETEVLHKRGPDGSYIPKKRDFSGGDLVDTSKPVPDPMAKSAVKPLPQMTPAGVLGTGLRLAFSLASVPHSGINEFKPQKVVDWISKAWSTGKSYEASSVKNNGVAFNSLYKKDSEYFSGENLAKQLQKANISLNNGDTLIKDPYGVGAKGTSYLVSADGKTVTAIDGKGSILRGNDVPKNLTELHHQLKAAGKDKNLDVYKSIVDKDGNVVLKRGLADIGKSHFIEAAADGVAKVGGINRKSEPALQGILDRISISNPELAKSITSVKAISDDKGTHFFAITKDGESPKYIGSTGTDKEFKDGNYVGNILVSNSSGKVEARESSWEKLDKEGSNSMNEIIDRLFGIKQKKKFGNIQFSMENAILADQNKAEEIFNAIGQRAGSIVAEFVDNTSRHIYVVDEEGNMEYISSIALEEGVRYKYGGYRIYKVSEDGKLYTDGAIRKFDGFEPENIQKKLNGVLHFLDFETESDDITVLDDVSDKIISKADDGELLWITNGPQNYILHLESSGEYVFRHAYHREVSYEELQNIYTIAAFIKKGEKIHFVHKHKQMSLEDEIMFADSMEGHDYEMLKQVRLEMENCKNIYNQLSEQIRKKTKPEESEDEKQEEDVIRTDEISKKIEVINQRINDCAERIKRYNSEILRPMLMNEYSIRMRDMSIDTGDDIKTDIPKSIGLGDAVRQHEEAVKKADSIRETMLTIRRKLGEHLAEEEEEQLKKQFDEVKGEYHRIMEIVNSLKQVINATSRNRNNNFEQLE